MAYVPVSGGAVLESPQEEKFHNKKNVSVEVILSEELTEDEQRERLRLERKVGRAFYEAGKALRELRDKRLYRSTHKTFEEYSRDRFGHSRQKSNYLIAAAIVYDNLTTIGCQNFPIDNLTNNGTQILSTSKTDDLTTNGCQNLPIDELTTNKTQVLPTSERQVRPLTKLEVPQQREVWEEAVETAGGKVPSGRIVKDIVQRIMERTKVPNPYRVGEVCQILPKENPELKGKSGCWCIVSAVNDFSCTVTAWDGEYTIALQNLKSKDYSDVECEQMREICDRVTAVQKHRISQRYSSDMEEAARAVLKSLGELKRPYLTQLEQKLLGLLEEEFV